MRLRTQKETAMETTIKSTRTIEYKVRPVTRYLVTRFESHSKEGNGADSGGSVGSSVVGEFDNADMAQATANALWTQEYNGRGFCAAGQAERCRDLIDRHHAPRPRHQRGSSGSIVQSVTKSMAASTPLM